MGFLIIPHELLHVLGYRLVGKRCTYRWGEIYVVPERPLTRRQALIGLLCPLGVCTLVGLVSAALFALAFLTFYHHTRALIHLLWSIIMGAVALLAVFNALVSISDLQTAYRLLFDPPDNKTPFDRLARPLPPLTPERQVFIFGMIAVCLALLLVLGKQ